MSKEQTELLADYFTKKPETTTTEILEILFMSNTHMIEEWNCQEMCSQRIPKICNRQVSGGMVSQPG
jgi:hypothetical protein